MFPKRHGSSINPSKTDQTLEASKSVRTVDTGLVLPILRVENNPPVDITGSKNPPLYCQGVRKRDPNTSPPPQSRSGRTRRASNAHCAPFDKRANNGRHSENAIATQGRFASHNAQFSHKSLVRDTVHRRAKMRRGVHARHVAPNACTPHCQQKKPRTGATPPASPPIPLPSPPRAAPYDRARSPAFGSSRGKTPSRSGRRRQPSASPRCRPPPRA